MKRPDHYRGARFLAKEQKNLGDALLGVIFTGGEGPKAAVVKRIMEKEAKGAFIVAADSGLIAAREAGINPDFIIGDMDSIDDESTLSSYPPESVSRFERDKDYTDTELAYFSLLEKGRGEIWIIGGGGGRIDHLFALRSLFERDVFPLRWLTDAADIRCVDALSGVNELRANIEKGAIVSVFPLGAGPWEAESAGLKWSLKGLAWDRGFVAISNIAVEGDFAITAGKGRFMVILPLPVFNTGG